jgi:hypothetical protein
MPSNHDLIEAARSYMGCKWMHQGRNRVGIDCAGLIVCATADAGSPIADMQGYRRSPDPEKFLGHIRDNTLPEIEPLPGTMAIFRGSSQPCHIGIFTEYQGVLGFIHSNASVGQVMEEPFLHEWPRLLIEIRRFKGFDY